MTLPQHSQARIAAGEHPMKVIREYRGLTIEDLSCRTDLSGHWLAEVEAKERFPTLEQADIIAGALDVERLAILAGIFDSSFDASGSGPPPTVNATES